MQLPYDPVIALLGIYPREMKSYIHTKYLQTINAGEGVQKSKPSCPVGGNVNWYSHYGEQYGGSLKN